MAGSNSTNHSMGPTTCEEEVVEQRVEVDDDSCSVVRVDWEDNNNIVGRGQMNMALNRMMIK